MKTRAIQPITLQTTDGQERKFLLTRGSINRLRAKLSVSTLGDILARVAADQDGAMGVFLYECLQDKGTLTEDQFLEIMPFSVEQDQEAVARILGVSMPEKTEDRPPQPPLKTQ